jgi:Spy/CpxP family protein refolding chaperone
MKTRLFGGALMALGAIALTGVPAIAQAGPATDPGIQAHHKGQHGHFGKALKELNLTGQQKADLKPILKDRHAQAKAIRTDTALTREQKREKMKELMKATHEKIAAILTADQKAKLKAMRGMRHKKGA